MTVEAVVRGPVARRRRSGWAALGWTVVWMLGLHALPAVYILCLAWARRVRGTCTDSCWLGDAIAVLYGYAAVISLGIGLLLAVILVAAGKRRPAIAGNIAGATGIVLTLYVLNVVAANLLGLVRSLFT